MHTFTTADPISIEVRNAAGTVLVDLTRASQTSVEVVAKGGHPFGFIDEIVRSFSGRSAGTDGPGWAGGWHGSPDPDSQTGLADLVRVEMTRRDDTDTLIVDADPASRIGRASFAICITAPPNSSVRVHSQSAEVTVRGQAGRLDIRSASGDVVADSTGAAARLQTASGSIRIHSAGGELSAKSASGGVEVGAVTGTADIQSTSGTILVREPAADVNARTVSGDVRILDATRGRTDVTSVSGDVEIGVHPGSLAAVNLTTISGQTLSDLQVSDKIDGLAGPDAPDAPDGPPETDASGMPAPDESGAGDLTLDIRVRTTSGDIRLRRAVLA